MPGIWQTISAKETAERLQVDMARGLKEGEAQARLERVGANELEKGPEIAMWQALLNQFKDFMVLVLLAATVISGFLGEWSDAITISIIVLFNALLGMVQEYRAERSMESLRKLTAPEARVIRDSNEKKIPAAELAPGDIVLLEAGDRLPADIRLVQALELEVVEAALTGESTPVPKHDRQQERETGLADAKNMVFMGTDLTRGRGKGIVVATGMSTEVGQVAGMIREAEQEPTPLQKRLAQLGKGLVTFCMAVCALVVFVGIYRGEPVYQMFLTGVSLAVAAIPEGLPAIVTVALAIGVQRMIKRNAIIRRLPAVETLGCATFICSDKTGTLTQNEMTVRQVYLSGNNLHITGEGYDPKGKFTGDGLDMSSADFSKMMSIAALCNNANLLRNNIKIGGFFRGSKPKGTIWKIFGDPTEGALLVMAAKAGFWRERLEKKEKRIAEIPFDSERKRMTVVTMSAGKKEAIVKGAPDVVLRLCTHYLRGSRKVAMDKRTRAAIMKANTSMAEGALRVLALAYRELPSDIQIEQLSKDIERDLVFVGLVGMIDPPRPAAISAVHTCHRAGIRVAMITGDHQITASAVAREMGIAGRDTQVINGDQLERMSDGELTRLAENISIYARVSPRHKLRIVRALKRNGHVVAMTGDGVNDAPAIKEADIGIAMGITGTDVSREASAMVLADDNFSSIVAAVEEGRGIYDNIRKFIRYLLSCNVGEVLVMLLALLGGMPLPLLPIQILWMNLVTDGLPAMALGVEPIERNIMRRPPRNPQESIFAHGLGWRVLSSGMVIAGLTLAVFGVIYTNGHNLELSRTMAFNTLVFLQLFYVFSCRSEHVTIGQLGVFSNPHLIYAVLISMGMQVGVNYISFLQPVFHTVPLSLHHWITIISVALLPTATVLFWGELGSRLRERVTYLKV